MRAPEMQENTNTINIQLLRKCSPDVKMRDGKWYDKPSKLLMCKYKQR